MVGLFLFPVKPTEEQYRWKKKPREVLEADDAEVLANRNLHYLRYDEAYDGLTDAELFKKMGNLTREKLTLGRRSGKGFLTEEKTYFVRILRNEKKWFKGSLGF